MSTKTFKVESISGNGKYQVFYTEVITDHVMFNENLAVSELKQTAKEIKVANKGYSYEI